MSKTIAVSGGFDPLHAGHLSLFRAARELAGLLDVIVDSDEFVARKRPPLMPQLQRAEVVGNCRLVDGVHLADGADACSALGWVRPDLYGVGPDHADLDFPEREVCKRLGIEVRVVHHARPDVHSRDLLARAAKPRWVNPPVTVDGLVERGGRLLVIRRGPACEAGVGLLDLPGGFLEENENLENCLWRECKEEVGTGVIVTGYVSSTSGTLPDGRPFVNVILAAQPFDSWMPCPTPEASDILWCDRMPEGAWFSECCRLAAQAWFRGRGR